MDYVLVETQPSDADTLDVRCSDDISGLFSDVVTDDLGVAGSKFNQKLTFDLFWANFQRLIGYGAPVAAFAVKAFSITSGMMMKVGCSLGPLSDYVVVDFTRGALRTLPHEFGHACNLLHDNDNDPDNLMTPGSKGGVGVSLSRLQKAVLRASRHVTYF